MNLGRLAALGLGWGVALLWSSRTIAWLHGMSQLPDLLAMPAGQPRGRVSVVVPARNEEPQVAAGLRSLRASQGVDVEVIAVDDRSGDETGPAMDALDAEPCAPRVRYLVEHVRKLPDGWLGKPHAMARGVERSTGEWLLFTDADVIFREDTLARALAYLEREGADHLVVAPTVVAGSAGEAMMLPFLHVLSIWGPRLWRVADPRSARDSAGVGAFNMMRRSAYESVGGWERLRMEVIEDMRMGYTLKRAGFASRVVTGRDLVRIRWAHGAWGVVTNLTKNVFAAFRFRLSLMLAGTLGTVVLCLLPVAGMALGLTVDRAWLWPSLVSLASVSAMYWRYGRFADPGGRRTLLWFGCFPLAASLFVYAMVRSTVLTLARGGVVWRGTLYPLSALRQHAGPLR